MTTRKFGLLFSSLLYGVGGGIQRLIGFLLLPLFTRFLNPGDYGIVGLLSAASALLVPIFSLGLGASIGVFYYETNDEYRRQIIIDTAKWITYLSVGVLLSIGYFEIDWIAYAATNATGYVSHTVVVIITVALSVLCLPLQLEQQLSGRALEFVSISLIGAVLASISNTVFIVYFGLGAYGMLLGIMAGQFVVWILLILTRRRRQLPRGGGIDWRVAKSMLKYGAPMLISFVLLFIIQNFVRWPLERRHGVDAVGLYSIGTSFGAAITLFTSGFVTAWLPWVMTHAEQWEKGRRLVASRLLQYIIGGGVLVFIFFSLAQPVLWVVAAPIYFDAWMVVGLSAAANLMISLFSLFLPPLYMTKKVYLVILSQGFAAVLTVAVTYLLLDYGVIGAAFAVFIGATVLVLGQIFVNFRFVLIKPIPLDWIVVVECFIIIFIACSITFYLVIDQVWIYAIQVVMLFFITSFLVLRRFPERQHFLNKLLKDFA
jgi:O-antigen/teichoic acid export membrane protein